MSQKPNQAIKYAPCGRRTSFHSAAYCGRWMPLDYWWPMIYVFGCVSSGLVLLAFQPAFYGFSPKLFFPGFQFFMVAAPSFDHFSGRRVLINLEATLTTPGDPSLLLRLFR